MSRETVRHFFRLRHMEHRIMSLQCSTATVVEAARAHRVVPGQIAKTLSFMLDGEPLLILTAGDCRIDNKKYKAHFGRKAKMLSPEEVVLYTGHELGGVCPFGLMAPVRTFLDVSLRLYHEVLPAAGDRYSAIRLSLDELEECSASAGWIDVCG